MFVSHIERKPVYADGVMVDTASLLLIASNYFQERGDAASAARAAKVARDAYDIGRRIAAYRETATP